MKKLPLKKSFVIPALLVVLLAGSLLVYNHVSSQHLQTADKSPAVGQPQINMNGPTDAEKKSGNDAKSQVLEEEKARTSTPAPAAGELRNVTPVITYADQTQYGNGQVEVGAYVNGIFENGGVCTLTLTKESITRTANVNAVEDANAVDCPAMVIPWSSLDVGTWQAIVTYHSSTSQGTSAPRNVEVKEKSTI